LLTRSLKERILNFYKKVRKNDEDLITMMMNSFEKKLRKTSNRHKMAL